MQPPRVCENAGAWYERLVESNFLGEFGPPRGLLPRNITETSPCRCGLNGGLVFTSVEDTDIF